MAMRVNENKQYIIEGFYTFNGKKEEFEGELVYVPKDNTIVGVIVDEVTSEKDKLVVGVLNGHNLRFWKMLPIQNMSRPIIYNVSGTTKDGFKGYWGAFNNLEDYFHMLSLIPEISESFRLDSTEKQISNLEKIASVRLAPFFDERLMNPIYEFGKANNNYTEFKLRQL